MVDFNLEPCTPLIKTLCHGHDLHNLHDLHDFHDLHNLVKGKYVLLFYFFIYAFFCPGTMTTHAESINSDLQRGLDRRLRHTQQ